MSAMERVPDGDPSLGLLRTLRDDGSTDPATDPCLPRETLLRMYREMRKMRVLETRMVGLQRQGRVGVYGNGMWAKTHPHRHHSASPGQLGRRPHPRRR